MNSSICVNLHTHSLHSDGELSPENLAERLAESGVRAAALTDHDSVAGLEAFGAALARKGIGSFTGVELTAASVSGEEIHLLGYGFDPHHPALHELLAFINDSPLSPELPGHSPSLSGVRRPVFAKEDALRHPVKLVPAGQAITAVHQAGGSVYLAHPVLLGKPWDRSRLVELLRELQRKGLDGIEAYYADYPENLRLELASLARELGLKVCGGSDFHGSVRPGSSALGIDLPLPDWNEFRNTVLRGESSSPALRSLGVDLLARPNPADLKRKVFWARILIPTVLTIGLFIVALFLILIPSFENRLLDRKRDMIRELTNVAFSILSEYEVDARQGRLTTPEAQRIAADRLQNLRYGNESKDYFWVTDLHPRMIMHPYRTDLNGQDLINFQDPRGVRIFVEFVNALKTRPDAYVEYVWQWKDDPDRLVPKQSYIKKFEPWGWIVGTGLYIEDVQREIRTIAGRLIQISAAISALCVLLLAFVAGQSLRAERRRLRAEADLRESHEKYRTLAESSTEGTLMILDKRPTFANPTMLDLLGYSANELGLLDLTDIFPEDLSVRGDGLPVAEALRCGWTGDIAIETRLRTRSGRPVKIGLAVTRVAFGGREGYVLATRDLSGTTARAGDIRRREIEQENLIGELQASLLFLHEPVGPIAEKPIFCDLQESVTRAAVLMSTAGASAIVLTAAGQPIGLFTDHDIRVRVVAAARPADLPVAAVMSAPLISVDETALVYEAILAMREKNVDHLLVRDEAGRVTGLIRNRDLLLFHRFSPAVLTAEIKRARTSDEIARARRGLPPLVKTLIEGGAKARNITRAITAVSDAAVERLIDLAVEKLGPPPAAFSFIGLGSQGREEQTLSTDQDHAIVFQDVPESDVPAVQRYFLTLGEEVSSGLQASGIPLCLGKIMADNPQWVQPLRTWKSYFETWLRTAEPQDILDIQIFFDFRRLAGERTYIGELRRHIEETLRQEPPFLLHYAQSALQYKTPISFFGNLVPEATKEGVRSFNLKDALMPVVNLARLYAIRHAIPETNTLDRLRALADIGELRRPLHDDAVRVYDFLMQLRLGHQAGLIGRGLEPDNNIDPRTVTPLEETLLKQSFAHISNIQKKVSFDFLGSA